MEILQFIIEKKIKEQRLIDCVSPFFNGKKLINSNQLELREKKDINIYYDLFYCEYGFKTTLQIIDGKSNFIDEVEEIAKEIAYTFNSHVLIDPYVDDFDWLMIDENQNLYHANEKNISVTREEYCVEINFDSLIRVSG